MLLTVEFGAKRTDTISESPKGVGGHRDIHSVVLQAGEEVEAIADRATLVQQRQLCASRNWGIATIPTADLCQGCVGSGR